MKPKDIFIAALLLMLAGVQTGFAQKVVLYKTNGETIKCDVSELDSLVFEEKEPPAEETHEYVDLGLPSGTLWATCNIGSDSPEQYGDYFAWGETEPKDNYTTSNYKFNRGSGLMTKYCTISSFGSGGMTDGLTELLPEDDAATVNWGNDWQMPSKDQIEELLDPSLTTSKWTSLNDFYGTKITSIKNGNWIFLPATGFVDGNSINRLDSYGTCWTRSLKEDGPRDAYDWGYMWSGIFWGADRRYMGENVRPVRVEKIPRTPVSEIILSESSINLQPEETKNLTAKVLPADAFFPEVIWESSDEMVAYVDSNGLVTAFCPGTCIITCHAIDGSGIFAECQVAVEEPDYHEYVDLGLPSGTLWATCNIGANSPEEYGGYFAWGETEPKEIYSWETYKYCRGSNNSLTKYCFQSNYGFNGFTDNLAELEPEDDAATANWGNSWQMPSLAQYEELINTSNTTITWTIENNVYGRLVKSNRNDNSIFLPAAGYYRDGGLQGKNSSSCYWSHSLGTTWTSQAFRLDNLSTEEYFRCHGYSVRPVRVQQY